MAAEILKRCSFGWIGVVAMIAAQSNVPLSSCQPDLGF